MNLHRFHYYFPSYLGPLQTDILILFLKIFQHPFRVEGPTKQPGCLCPFLLRTPPPLKSLQKCTQWVKTISDPLTLPSSRSPSHAGHWRGWGVQYQTTRGLVRLGVSWLWGVRRGPTMPTAVWFHCVPPSDVKAEDTVLLDVTDAPEL